MEMNIKQHAKPDELDRYAFLDARNKEDRIEMKRFRMRWRKRILHHLFQAFHRNHWTRRDARQACGAMNAGQVMRSVLARLAQMVGANSITLMRRRSVPPLPMKNIKQV